MTTTRSNHQGLAKAFRLVVAAGLLCAGASRVMAQDLRIGLLEGPGCSDADQRHWYPRVPPYVGQDRGERTSAGGDGTCYLGFPVSGSFDAQVRVNGEVVELVPVRYRTNGTSRFRSRDGRTSVVVKPRGTSSTCVPGEDKCCGEFTYADVTVRQGKASATVKAARYVGG